MKCSKCGKRLSWFLSFTDRYIKEFNRTHEQKMKPVCIDCFTEDLSKEEIYKMNNEMKELYENKRRSSIWTKIHL